MVTSFKSENLHLILKNEQLLVSVMMKRVTSVNYYPT